MLMVLLWKVQLPLMMAAATINLDIHPPAMAAAAAPGPVRTFRNGKVFCRRIAAMAFFLNVGREKKQRRF